MASHFQDVHEELLEKFDQIEGEYQSQGGADGDTQDSLARMEIRYSGNTKYEKLQDGNFIFIAVDEFLTRPLLD